LGLYWEPATNQPAHAYVFLQTRSPLQHRLHIKLPTCLDLHIYEANPLPISTPSEKQFVLLSSTSHLSKLSAKISCIRCPSAWSNCRRPGRLRPSGSDLRPGLIGPWPRRCPALGMSALVSFDPNVLVPSLYSCLVQSYVIRQSGKLIGRQNLSSSVVVSKLGRLLSSGGARAELDHLVCISSTSSVMICMLSAWTAALAALTAILALFYACLHDGLGYAYPRIWGQSVIFQDPGACVPDRPPTKYQERSESNPTH
jgi:hypothetical protein